MTDAIYSGGGQAGSMPGASIGDVVTALNNANRNTSLMVQAINSKFPNWVTVPANTTASGVAGQVAYDTSFFYVCVSSNAWRRVAVATW